MNGAHQQDDIDKLRGEVKKLKAYLRKLKANKELKTPKAQKIDDYQILSANSPDMLTRYVMEEMRHNFQPQGGVAINGGGVYLQAMVKYATTETEKG